MLLKKYAPVFALLFIAPVIHAADPTPAPSNPNVIGMKALPNPSPGRIGMGGPLSPVDQALSDAGYKTGLCNNRGGTDDMAAQLASLTAAQQIVTRYGAPPCPCLMTEID